MAMLVGTLLGAMSPCTVMARLVMAMTPAPSAVGPLALIRASKLFSSVL